MTFNFRRKPLALIVCCTFTGTLAAGVTGPAQSAEVLRVDPRLLGITGEPASPAQPVIGRPPTAPASIAPVAPMAPVGPPPAAPPVADQARPPALPVDETAPAARQTGGQAPSDEAGKRKVLPPAASTPAAPSVPSATASASPTPPSASAPKLARDKKTADRSAKPSGSRPTSTDAAPLALRPATTLDAVPEVDSRAEATPVFVSAERIAGSVDREVVAEGKAEVRRSGVQLSGDRLVYRPPEDEVEGSGNLRLQQGDDVIVGAKMRLKLAEQTGFVEPASYSVKRQVGRNATESDVSVPGESAETFPETFPKSPEPDTSSGYAAPHSVEINPASMKRLKRPTGSTVEARGDAERIEFQGENQLQLSSASYTTCKPGNDDWYLRIDDLHLDYDTNVGTGTNASVQFLGVPILYSPWLSFPLNNQRKSGILAPTYGSTSDSGFEFTLPYYWNIAPNMDATFFPRFLSKRGLQLGTDFRYLGEFYQGLYNGNLHLEYLPGDRERHLDRWGVSLSHLQTLAPGLTAAVAYNRVSDDHYYTDLSSQISTTAKAQLLQQGVLNYQGGGWWNAKVNFQSFQTLQPDAQNLIIAPYRMLPQVTFNARQPDLYATDSSLFGQYTRFVAPANNQVEGQRLVVQPQISLPYVTPGWYVVPRVGVNATHYALSYPGTVTAGENSISRTVPIFSIDSGMVFERDTRLFDRDYTQTLEPRLYYLNIPYRDQSRIPVFDTALADFSFAQIFADNKFSGWDRISNANQLTAALTSRLIDPANGREIMRGMLGQRLYLADDQVTLPGLHNRQGNKSDLLAAFTGQLLPKLYADLALQYNPTDQSFQRYSVGTRYLPAAGKVLNVSYNYNADTAIPIKQFDISGQWPINGQWNVVGRYNYSFLQHQPIEIIAGAEYNAGCWALRLVGHRVQTTEANASTQFFVQLEFNDFSRIGSNPLNLLQRRIPGYSLANPAVTDTSSMDK
ncbi:MAG TPA: LPS assembly protein LptD [Accumulibacter sp.]|nr:LPS assembly protein LptD [Accumulibacter sp.]HMW18979.1 LPS assembly protein LptD [Accumulibacter sp.]HMX23559.1 LPS assembly protein LptD [Accumulibacter sp.]HND81145.1 LPS assembly protein LptD [Accumulibacter sp.]HNG39438.1 LPS assembly protein LptD [Accumulibacter sp.]